MLAGDRFDRFATSLERLAGQGHVAFDDVVRLAGETSLSMVEAGMVLDSLVNRGGLERAHVDASGRVLTPDEAVACIGGYTRLGAGRCRVVWRRRTEAYLLA